jgi:hypothetical protein
MMKKGKTAYTTNKSFSDLKETLDKSGIDSTTIENRLRSESKARA